MRRLILFGMLATLALPSGATKRVTVAQLEKILANASAAHRTDDSMVRIFGDLELTEQLDNAARGQMDAKLHLGPKTTLALQLLADQSAFLDPPASERPVTAVPDPTTQQHILNAARAYAAHTMAALPDLMATRSSFRFDNSEQILGENEWPIHAGLHLVGSSTREVTMRNSHDPPEPAQKSNATPASYQREQPDPGLQLSGEFGAPVPLILVDIDKGKLTFSHWEQTPAGAVAVYRYSVPKSASHYNVDYCCIVDKAGVALRQGRRGGGGAPPPATLQDDLANHFHKLPAYHGSLAIDPVSGAILRITVQAELDIDGPVTQPDFDHQSHIHPGDIADGQHVTENWQYVSRQYHNKGYLKAAVHPVPTFDRTQGTVSFLVTVEPGPVYSMGSLRIDNVGDDLRTAMLAAWKMPAGAVFNESAVLNFYAIGDVNPGLKRVFASVNCKYNLALNDNTHTVDVVLRLEKRQ